LLEAISAMAPVVESFFIGDARRLLPRIADEARRAEGDAFLRQEAAHAGMHGRFNRLLARWGVPVEPIADSALRWLAIVDWTSSDLRSAVAMAGEHFLGEIGNAILSRPELLDGVDPRIARLFAVGAEPVAACRVEHVEEGSSSNRRPGGTAVV
jgi:uncharacterized protein